MTGTLRKKRNRQMAEINVVPYIDVMLVLLIIFMVTAPLLSQGVKVDLPEVAAKAIPTDQLEPIILSIDASGNYYLNIANNPDRAIGTDELFNRVAAELRVSSHALSKRDVLIKGDRGVNYGKVVRAMALLQQAGASTVGLMTQEPLR
jgi:biopolymer transport protein TolR